MISPLAVGIHQVMAQLLRFLAFGVAAAVAAGATFLAWRIADQRAAAPRAVASILAAMDPAIDQIPPERIDWLIRVEDPTFWTNDGVDLSTPGAGQTTLAQGLGKRLFFKSFRPGPLKLAKLELMVLTRFALIPTVSKRDILRATVATAYLGSDDAGPVYGFAQGARRWFRKPLEALAPEEFLALVAMLPAPNALKPGGPENAERVRRMRRLLAGACAPKTLDDIYFVDCATR